MPSTFTTNLGIQKPADGEQDGVWGDVVNDNMDIVDRAVNGQLTLMLTGTSSTLTTSNGIPSNGQYKMLVLSGTPSGTHTITISPDTAQKIYFVQNNTTKSVVFTQGSGGNVTILPSDSAIIYCDGATATARVQNLTTSLSLAPSFTLPREYGVIGDGTTNDTVNFQNFVLGATSSAYGLIPPAVYRVGDAQVNDLADSRVVYAPGAVFERTPSTANMLTLRRAQHVDVESLTLDGRFDTLATDGHGLVLIDPIDVAVDRLTARDFGGSVGGGIGFTTYTISNPAADRVRVTGSSFEGGVSSKSSALNITNGRYCTVSDSHSYNTTGYGLSFQPGTESSVMSSSTGTWNAQSFTLAGTSGSCHNNILGLLASNNSDAAVTVLTSINNVIIGVSAHADTQPDIFGNGHAYGVHLSTGADENLALGILASGTTMDYPVRFRSNRSVASVADYSDALKTVTFNAGAQENYVEILHLGSKGTSVVPFIADLNSPLIPKGPGANVIDSPLTRQYFGSVNNHFTWSLAGYTTNYAHFSTTSFLFNGFGGNSVLGLGVGTDGEAGVSVSTAATGGVGSIRYVNATGAPYWRYDVGGVQTFRLDTTKLAPVTSGGMALGSGTVPFSIVHSNNLEVGNGVGVVAGSRVRVYKDSPGSYSNSHIEMLSVTGDVVLGFHAIAASAVNIVHPRGGERLAFVNGLRTAYIPIDASAFVVSSDYRIKENIAPLDNAVARLSALQPKRFNFLESSMMYRDGITVDGFIAHEVSAVVPEAVTGEKDAVNAEGTPIYQGIDQAKLVPLLTAALQEALAKITALEARVAALEA